MGCGYIDSDQVAGGKKTAMKAENLESHTILSLKQMAKMSPALTSWGNPLPVTLREEAGKQTSVFSDDFYWLCLAVQKEKITSVSNLQGKKRKRKRKNPEI